MKKLMLLAGLYCLQLSLYASSYSPYIKYDMAPINANDRAKANFKENYDGVRDVNWFTQDDKNMYCIFHQGDTVNRVFYDKHGYWKYTLMSYPGYDLPQHVKEQVMDNFKCYQIPSVTEIRSNNIEPVFMINIENEDRIKVIKVIGDEFEVQQELEKR
jgi:hypothetical protein